MNNFIKTMQTFDYCHNSRDTFDKVKKRKLKLGNLSIASKVYLMDKCVFTYSPIKS